MCQLRNLSVFQSISPYRENVVRQEVGIYTPCWSIDVIPMLSQTLLTPITRKRYGGKLCHMFELVLAIQSRVKQS